MSENERLHRQIQQEMDGCRGTLMRLLAGGVVITVIIVTVVLRSL